MESIYKPCARPPGWYCLARLLFRLFARLLFRVRIVGQVSNLPGQMIVVANHLSWIDPFLVMLALPAQPRLYFIGAQQALNRGWKAWLVRHLDMMIPFERGALWIGKDLIRKSSAVLQSGALLGIFPEGTLGSREGELLPLQRGVGHLLVRECLVVLPIALSGVQELYLGKSITITIGRPITIHTAGLGHHQAVDAAMAQVEHAMRGLLTPYVEPPVRVKRMRFLTNLLG